ncbi:MAG: type II secretion system minor pseudopilin GspI [Granulosicoccus sp.]
MSARRIHYREKAGLLAGGFTLIEILVAMTIIAVGVSALVSSAGASSWRASYLRDREMGRWVASNVLTELQVRPAWPDNGTKNSEVEMGSTVWHVKTITQKVADPDLRRVDVEVRKVKDADNYIYAASGFVGNPATRLLQ